MHRVIALVVSSFSAGLLVTGCGSSTSPPSSSTKHPSIQPSPRLSAKIEDISLNDTCARLNSTSQPSQGYFVIQYDDSDSYVAYNLIDYCRQNPEESLNSARDAVISSEGGTPSPLPSRSSSVQPLTDESLCSEYDKMVHEANSPSVEWEIVTAYLGVKSQNGYPVLHHTPVLDDYCYKNLNVRLGDAAREVERNPDAYGGR